MRTLRALTSSAFAAMSVLVITPNIAYSQSSGNVPANCTINASSSTLTCTTTVALTGVTGTFSNGTLTLAGGAAGPQCNGGLAATPQSGLSPNTATAISLQACPSNTNRSALNFRWVSPAVAANGQDPWFGTATATVPAGQSVTYSVDVCDSSAANAACTRVTTAPITTAGTAPTCSAISPATQTVFQNAAATALNANCSGATSYQWYTGSSPANGGVLISGATGATYTPPTSIVGQVTYSVRAFNGTQFTDNANTASVTVQQVVSGGCPAGEPRFRINYSTSVQNYTYQALVGSDSVRRESGSVFVVQVTVAATDSSLSKQYPPTFNFTQDDTSPYSPRTISVSQNCADFSPSAVVASGFDTSTITLLTSGDSRSGLPRFATLSPGVWYINVKNDGCPSGVNCSISGIWRNFNR